MSLKDLREKQGLTQEETAGKIGITLRQYQRFESNKAPLTRAAYKTVATLAKILHVTPEKLIKTQEEKIDGINNI